MGAMVGLSWTPNGPVTRVVRDGNVVVYEGPGSSASDVPPRIATYTVFTCNGCGDCSLPSVPRVVDIVPDAGALDFDAGRELRPLTLDARLSADAGAVSLTWIDRRK